MLVVSALAGSLLAARALRPSSGCARRSTRSPGRARAAGRRGPPGRARAPGGAFNRLLARARAPPSSSSVRRRRLSRAQDAGHRARRARSHRGPRGGAGRSRAGRASRRRSSRRRRAAGPRPSASCSRWPSPGAARSSPSRCGSTAWRRGLRRAARRPIPVGTSSSRLRAGHRRPATPDGWASSCTSSSTTRSSTALRSLVTVTVADGRPPRLTVRDHGPGCRAADGARVRPLLPRQPAAGVAGSGLGLRSRRRSPSGTGPRSRSREATGGGTLASVVFAPTGA